MSVAARAMRSLPAGAPPAQRVVIPTLLFLLGCAIAAIQLRSFVLLHDEGLVLQAAARIADGDWPYRDFWWNYGPGQPLLLAMLEPLSQGPSLLAWRLLWLVEAALVAVLVFLLVRRHAPLGWALAGWVTAIFLVVVPRLPHPHVLVTVLALAALLLARARPGVAGALAGAAVFFRPELGIFVVAAVTVAAGRRGAGRVFMAAAVAAALSLAPFLAAAGPGRVLDQTLGFDLGAQALQRLPLVTEPPSGSDLVDRLHHYLPFVLVVTSGIASLLVSWLGVRRGGRRLELLALVPLCVGGIVYIIGRADLLHLVPLAAIAPTALALAAATASSAGSRLAVGLSVVALGLLLLDGVARRIDIADMAAPAGRVPGPAGDGVRIDPATATALARIGTALDERAPGAPIWVGNARHDRITAGATLAYVILDRSNATRYDVLQPGVVTEQEVQREIAADLSRARAPVVRWLGAGGAAPEQSEAARMNGALLLDTFLQRNYRVDVTAGEWQLLLWAAR